MGHDGLTSLNDLTKMSYKTYASSILAGCWLALGAEVGAAVADSYTLNNGATNRAELTAKAVSNLELKVGCPQCAIGAEVGIHTGSFITNSCP